MKKIARLGSDACAAPVMNAALQSDFDAMSHDEVTC
jgi:hypothetical protein